MYFQVSDYKGKHFLELNNNNNEPICSIYSKGGAWLKHFGFSNSLCTCITRLITNHAPIGEYRLRFFPNKPLTCPCGNFPIETRAHGFFFFFLNQQFIMRGAMADRGSYLVATVH